MNKFKRWWQKEEDLMRKQGANDEMVLRAMRSIAEMVWSAAQPQWQPIETAPKDGAWIIAWRGTALLGEWSPLVIAQWSECEGIWVWPDGPYDVWSAAGREAANKRMEDGGMFVDDKFTHWMPLPEAPQGDEK